ncbi:hypothetical protein ACT3SZ_11090 [Corynebacterium sp. AOP40-9SA-29]|uniref:hypothetical protein n=1 Tax=Corynebacterium sp. AOP40-9SA-29 TaxID=3457677 RepID=UPI004034D1D5
MTRERLSFLIVRLPVLELVVALLGVSGAAGALSGAGVDDRGLWNTMFLVCGALSALLSIILDVFVDRYRLITSSIIAAVGAALLYYVLSTRGVGASIGEPVIVAIAASLILSSLFRVARAGIASLVSP